MASKSVSQMLRMHPEVIGAIHDAVGAEPFTSPELRERGVEVPNDCHWTLLSARGVIVRADRGARQKPRVWRLSADVLEYYAAQEVTA